MKLIVIKNLNEINFYNSLISNLTSKNEKFIILALKGTKNLINFDSKSEEDYYGDLNKDMFFEAWNLYKSWGELKVNNITLMEFLKYKNIDMWDYMESNFISFLYEYFNDRLQMIKLFKKVIQDEKINCVYFVYDASVISNAILDVTGFYNIPVIGKRKYKLPNFKPFIIRTLRRYRNRKNSLDLEVKKNQVLFIISLNSAIDSILPIIKRTSDGLIIRQEIRVKEQLKNVLDSNNLDYVDFEKFCSFDDIKNVKDYLKIYNNKFKSFKKIKFSYLNIQLENSLEDIFDYFFGKRMFIEEILYVHEVGRNMIDICKPSLIFGLDESSGLAKPVYRYCREQKIPLVYMQNGVLNNREPTSYNSPTLDYYLAYGLRSKEFYNKRGIKNVIVTGWPKLDSVLDNRDKDSIMEKFSLPNKRIILFTSAVHKSINGPIFLALLDSAKELKEFQIIVKKHPGDELTTNEYLRLSAKYKTHVTILSSNLYDLFYVSDVIISFGSSTILEALAFDKPVISLNLTGVKDDLPYVGAGVCYEVYSKEDLKKAIDDVLNNKKVINSLKKARDKILKDLFYKIDGNSTKRVLDIINKIKLKY
ncbi:CDP-glycerol glycerophosphotransferase family protein [Candidatus Woesearchaeota archaeon]|nr:CDP-glycerol glycerophosphotransferase family protein [Candidatus Woesearchaeota archaeon]